MTNEPTSRLWSRVLALTILAAVVLSLGGVVAWPVAAWIAERHDTVERSLRLLSAYRRTASLRQGLDAELQSLRAREPTVPGRLEGSSTALAAANLQVQVKRIIDTNGGEIRSVQNLPSATTDGFEKIEIHHEFSAPLSGLVEMLYQIETATPYLFVDGLDVRGPEGIAPDGAGAKEPKLAIRWNIHGYRWAGTP